MKARCISNRGKDLSAVYRTTYHAADEYPLIIGHEYIVYGIYLADALLFFLVLGDNDRTYSCPAALFEITDHKLPSCWYFTSSNTHVTAVWGYKEFALDSDHFRGLMELEQTAIRIFWARKKEVDDACN